MPCYIDYKHIYCIFCRTGYESQIGDEIERRIPGVRALTAQQEKHIKVNGLRKVDRRIFLPGYLFLYGKNKVGFYEIMRIDGVYHVLGNSDHGMEMYGSDRAFAEWLWQNNGIIGMSRLRIRPDGVEFIAGPIKQIYGEILRIDKHTRNVLVRKKFLDRYWDFWLAFEFADEVWCAEDNVGKLL